MIDTTARWRSMVSGLSCSASSCREALLPAIEIQPLGYAGRSIGSHVTTQYGIRAAGRSVHRSASGDPSYRTFCSLRSVHGFVLLPGPATHPLLVDGVRAAVHPSPVGVSNRHVRICERLAAVAARVPRSWSARADRRRRCGAVAQLGWRLLVPVGVLQTALLALVAVPAVAAGAERRARARSRERARGRHRRVRQHGVRRSGSQSRLQEVAAALQNGTLAAARKDVRSAPVQLRADRRRRSNRSTRFRRPARRRASAMRSSRYCRLPAACRSPASC